MQLSRTLQRRAKASPYLSRPCVSAAVSGCAQAFLESLTALDSHAHTSQSVSMTLVPTLWRTCRVLANQKRLRLLHYVIKKPLSSVAHIATSLHLPVHVASEYLRALNARGLLRAKRQGRLVLYEAVADFSVPEAWILLVTVESAINKQHKTKDILFSLTGFTHPRRIELVRAIHAGAVDLRSLKIKTGCSTPAVTRHLRKLRRRGFVVSDHGLYRCATPTNPLAKTLLALALRSP
jgi:DNA-binding transcriptional ArsR family regulator